MEKYTVEELKQAWKALYFTDCNDLWADINLILCELLDRFEYSAFVQNANQKIKKPGLNCPGGLAVAPICSRSRLLRSCSLFHIGFVKY